MLADGGEAIADLAVLRDQAELFGPVASDPTAWRVLAGIDAAALARLRRGAGRGPGGRLGAGRRDRRRPAAARPRPGMPVAGLVLDIDATIVICHSEKEQRPRTWKTTLRLPPAAVLPGQHRRSPGRAAAARPGRVEHRRRPHHRPRPGAGADPRRPPARHRHPRPHRPRRLQPRRSCAHIRGLREHGIDTLLRRRRDHRTGPRRDPRLPDRLDPALDSRRRPARRRRGRRAHRPGRPAAGYPPGTRIIVRRERPHPGAQLSLFDTIEGMRHQVIATDTPVGGGSIQFLEVRHRAHARVEDRIRCGKTPASAGSRPATSRSTTPGSNSP